MDKFFNGILDVSVMSILNSIKDAVFLDSSAGYAIWCNQACCELYNITREELYGKHVLELEENGVFSPSVAKMALEEKKEITIIHENKEGKKLLSTGNPIFDEEGRLRGVVTTSRDITELALLQQRLYKAETSLKDINNLSPLYCQGIVVNSQSMFNVLQLARKLADLDSTVLITGESGVGKGVIAEYMHNNGTRSGGAFVKVNCGAIPETLIESELFGYERGAFTGSRQEGKMGLFETAKGGTIFLDEISELPLNLQVTLLQVIQEKEIKRVGGVKPIPIDVRIISATNKDLLELVKSGKFREDLYYRLNVVPIKVPPLRERQEDIFPLAQMYLEKNNQKMNEDKVIHAEAMDCLMNYSWPGNVRELQNIVERLIITTKEDIIYRENLPPYVINEVPLEEERKVDNQDDTDQQDSLSLKEALELAEKTILLDTYNRCGSTRATAKVLKISQPSVVRKLKKYGPG